MRVCVFVCVCVCVSLSLSLCEKQSMCVCVCERESESTRGRKSGSESMLRFPLMQLPQGIDAAVKVHSTPGAHHTTVGRTLCGADPLVAVPHTSMCMGVDSSTEKTGGPAREVLISPCGGT